MKIKNLKPTEIDAHIKYNCPNVDCKIEHWITLQESVTKNFLIVCDCGNIIKPKRIKKIKPVYHGNKTKKNKDLSNIDLVNQSNLMIKATKIMCSFGFDSTEAKHMLEQYYKHNPINDPLLLVKNTIAISQLGDINNE